MDKRKILKARIENLKNEVKEFHPLLEEIFDKMESITHVSKTHGPFERGADFVLTTTAPEFGDTEYIGVIVKVGKITASTTSVHEQIRECMEKRITVDGSKKIYLSEIWITSNGNISERAKEKIYDRYKTQKIRFLPLDRIVDLAEKHVPEFGTNLNIKDSSFLGKEREKSELRNLQFSLLPSNIKNLYIEPSVVRIDKSEFDAIGRGRTSVKILDEIKNHAALLIEAPMGGGKTNLFNRVVEHFANAEVYSNDRIMPIYMTCSELFKEDDISLSGLLQRICEDNDLTHDDNRTSLLLLDGLDEVFDHSPEKIDQFIAAINEVIDNASEPKVKIVITTRGISDEKLETEFEKRFRKYEIVPLTLNQIVSFISEICESLNLTSRLIEDLKDSALFRVLPRTPIAAIILAKLISEGTEEVPANLTELYSQYCELALGRWDIDKGLSSLKEYEASDAILTNIASFILENGLSHVAYSEARDQFHSYLNERHLSIDANELFSNILSRSGILVHSSDLDVISFKHRSFGEYFYAKSLMRRETVEISYKIFHPYWSNAYFFYVGQKKDCPDLLKQIVETDVTIAEGARLSKILNLGNFLLAAYKSPYYAIEEGVQAAFSDARQYYLDIRDARVESFFGQLPPVHLLAFFRAILQDGYSYPFFGKAIEASVSKIANKSNLAEDDLYELLLLDATRNDLGTVTAIQQLANIGKKKDALPIPIQMMICGPNHLKSDQAKILRPLEKRLRKQVKNSSLFKKAVRDASYKSLDGKTEYSDKGKRLEYTSKHAGSRKRRKRK